MSIYVGVGFGGMPRAVRGEHHLMECSFEFWDFKV